MSEIGPENPLGLEQMSSIESNAEPTAEQYLKALEPLKDLFDDESWASIVEEFQIPDGLDEAVTYLHTVAEGEGIHEQVAQALLEAGLYEDETGQDSPEPIA